MSMIRRAKGGGITEYSDFDKPNARTITSDSEAAFQEVAPVDEAEEPATVETDPNSDEA